MGKDEMETLFLREECGFLLINGTWNLGGEVESVTKMKNVGKKEAIFRFFIGVILIILAFFISGVFRWFLGSVGVVAILTALFGY
jgi:VIT1/CCC1 family predicted Fe2+/Mn2+ transporter